MSEKTVPWKARLTVALYLLAVAAKEVQALRAAMLQDGAPQHALDAADAAAGLVEDGLALLACADDSDPREPEAILRGLLG